MPLSEFTITLTSLKTAFDIIKSIQRLSKSVVLDEKIIELRNTILSIQNEMLSMQTRYSELIETNKNLKEELSKFEKWDEIASQYKLKEISGSGVFVYSFKGNSSSDIPSHWLCVKCFENRKRSILHLAKERKDPVKYICFECQNSIYVPREHSPHFTS